MKQQQGSRVLLVADVLTDGGDHQIREAVAVEVTGAEGKPEVVDRLEATAELRQLARRGRSERRTRPAGSRARPPPRSG